MNYSNELNTVNAKIETLNAQLAQLLKEQTILTQLVEMKEKMNVLEASLSAEEKAPFSVTDLTEENYKYYNCTFACKVNDEEDFNYSIESGSDEIELTQVRRIVELDSELFAQLKADTMGYFDFVTNFGGTTCLLDIEAKYPQYAGRFEGMDFVTLMDEDENVKADWRNNCAEIGTLFVDRNDKKDYLIASQQGYDYCRYISFPSHISEAPQPKTAA